MAVRGVSFNRAIGDVAVAIAVTCAFVNHDHSCMRRYGTSCVASNICLGYLWKPSKRRLQKQPYMIQRQRFHSMQCSAEQSSMRPSMELLNQLVQGDRRDGPELSNDLRICNVYLMCMLSESLTLDSHITDPICSANSTQSSFRNSALLTSKRSYGCGPRRNLSPSRLLLAFRWHWLHWLHGLHLLHRLPWLPSRHCLVRRRTARYVTYVVVVRCALLSCSFRAGATHGDAMVGDKSGMFLDRYQLPSAQRSARNWIPNEVSGS